MSFSNLKYEIFNDHDLIEKIISGDGYALLYLLKDCCGKYLNLLCIKNRAASLELDDLAHEVACIIIKDDYKALRSFRGHNISTNKSCTLVTYVLIIAQRHIVRKNKNAMTEIGGKTSQNDKEPFSIENHHPLQVQRELNWNNVAGNDDIFPDENCEDECVKLEIMDAIMKLEKAEERFVLIEYKLKGIPANEVAIQLGTTIGNVYTLCSRAQNKIRSMFEEGMSNYV